MIREDYCSYEVAKLLKEKGFPQEYDIYHSMVYEETVGWFDSPVDACYEMILKLKKLKLLFTK